MFLDGFQCCCDIHNCPIWNLVKQIIMACEDISRGNCHDIIQDSVVIIAHSAAYIGDLDTLKQIASDSVDDLHSMDINGWTPLHEVIEMLLHIYTFMGLF